MKGDNPLNRMASFCNAFFRLKPFNDLHAWITMAHWTEVWNTCTCKSTSKFFLSISLLWHFQSNKDCLFRRIDYKNSFEIHKSSEVFIHADWACQFIRTIPKNRVWFSKWMTKKVSLKFNFTKSLKYWYMLNEHVCSGYEKSFTLDL